MTTYHFGSQVTSTAFVEYDAVAVTAADASTILVAPRPVSGAITLLCRDAATGATLDPITVGVNGYWSTTTDDIPIIEVSADGTNWMPQYAREPLDAAILGGQSISTAVETANAASQAVADLSGRVTTLETTGGGGGGGGPVTASLITDASSTGRTVLTGDATAGRAALGAGTSNLSIGTTPGTAKDGAYQPTAANISDSGATGRALVRANDAATAKAALSLDQVSNTSDANKPVSSATAAALATKAPVVKWFATTAAAITAATSGQLSAGDEIRVLAP